jgi:hypothetical protein
MLPEAGVEMLSVTDDSVGLRRMSGGKVVEGSTRFSDSHELDACVHLSSLQLIAERTTAYGSEVDELSEIDDSLGLFKMSGEKLVVKRRRFPGASEAFADK